MRFKLQILVLALIIAAKASFGADQRAELWRRVNEAATNGLPKTAITNLEPIITGALKDHAYAEATKAVTKKITLETPKLDERIFRLEAEIPRAPSEMKPALESLLAQWYWQYYAGNRWRFMQRGTTAQPPGKDFTTWDLPRLEAEIDRQFARSLSDDAYLKATPISAWDDLIEKGTMPDSQRPTLYDFLAREAIDFYTTPMPGSGSVEEAFELPAGGPIFHPTADFLAWADRISGPEGPKLVGDTNATALKAVKLYRDLLRFHQNDPAPRLAYAAVDLERLIWGWNAAFGEEKRARYQSALEEFIRNNGAIDLSALAEEREARLFQEEGDLTAARELAGRGANVFSNSPGGALCRNLIREIESRSLEITTERVWNAPQPKISVRYRNITTIYFRAFLVDWETFLPRGHNLPEYSEAKEKNEVLTNTPALKWSANLPPTTDYKETTYALDAPVGLKPGYYFIAASPDEGFGAQDNIVSMTDVWASELALILRPRGGSIEGFVLEANSGEPVPGAEISGWALYDNGNWTPNPKLATDRDGFFSMKAEPGRSYVFRARQNGRELASPHAVVWRRWNENTQNKAGSSAVLFTDRAIYRPGQIIQYKGICLRADPAVDSYETLKGEL